MRLTGTLRSWNDDRGYGFIAPTHGGRELFVHISAFPRDGSRPTPGERLTYELGTGDNGKPQAVKVVRLTFASPRAPREIAQPRGEAARSGWRALVFLVIIVGLAWYGYQRYIGPTSRNAGQEAGSGLLAEPSGSTAVVSPPSVIRIPAVDPVYRCDGRIHCSHMTSCAEAKFFLKNCPNTKMDGDGDGVPCEEQWCTSLFAK